MRYRLIYLFFSAVLLSGLGCTEPYEPGTENFEDLLVVEATITNELKKQEIKLTRTFKFEETRAETVTDASVSVSDNMGNNYSFEYIPEDGLYISTTEFQALPNTEYNLNIITTDGENYVSEPEILPAGSDVSVDYLITEIDGQYGVQIVANSYDPTNSSHYYRYEYSETYKVVPPYWGPFQAVIIDGEIEYELRDNPETRICFSSQKSDDLILFTTVDQAEDRVANFPLRFIGADNYLLRYKYSILVKQYVENLESFTFYKTMKKVSGTGETVLSPNQPGFVLGNISSVNNSKEKIIGYFDVAYVSSERIFLEGNSLFPEITNQSYFQECTIVKLDKLAPFPSQDPNRLRDAILTGSLFLYQIDPVSPSIYWMTQPECTDCTTFASNEVPDFWQ